MNELSSSNQDISFIIKAHSLVKKAQESEQLGLIDDAIEYHLQASHYFTLAVKQTNNQQTISAIKVLSQNHFKKSNDLKNTKLIQNLKNINISNNNNNDEDNDDSTPHLLIYNDNNINNNLDSSNSNINFNSNFNMYNNINMNNKNNNNNSNFDNDNSNNGYYSSFNNSNYNNYSLSSSNPININNNVYSNNLNINNNNSNNISNNQNNNNNNNNSNNINNGYNNNNGSYSNSYNSMSDSTTDLSQISPNRLANYMNEESNLEDSVYESGFSNSILQGGYYIYPENGKPRFHQESSSLPSNLGFGTSPHSSFWFGIEKLLDILPKPNVFGLNKYSSNNNSNNNHQIHQRNKSTDDKSLINSFFIVDSSKRLPNSNNNNSNSFNNNNNNKVLNIINEDDEHKSYRPSSPNQRNNSFNNNFNNNSNIKNHSLGNSFDNDLASKLKQVELDLVNHTVETLLEENKNLKQENEFLKDRIMQFRIEIEKKTNAIRNSKESVPTQRYNPGNRLSHSISPSHDINQSVSLPTKTSASFYQTNLSTIQDNNNNKNNNSISLMDEIKYLREQLEEKDKVIDSQKKRWDKLIESAKKKREFNSSINSNTQSLSGSPLSNSIHE